MKTNKLTTTDLAEIGMSAAVAAVLSQVSVPTPSGVPLTAQTFAVALIGTVLGWKKGFMAMLVYTVLGLAGVPVFAGFQGGFHVIAGYAGGFIWGFLFLAALCGKGSVMKGKIAGILTGMAGLVICHLLGMLQFAVLSGNSLSKAFLLVSAPYLIKDILSVVFAFYAGKLIRKQMRKTVHQS